jgi:predicted RNA-binding Zn ribbon-like protein
VVNPELVIDFVNTAGFGPDREDLPTPEALVAWFEERGLEPGPRASQAEYEDALRVREALRDLLSAHNEVPVDVESATAVLDRAAREADLSVRFVIGGSQIEPAVAGVSRALGEILCDVSELMVDGTWERVKACRADDCRYAFVDTSKNRSRAWCSMQSCGNRAKVAAYRERHTA